MKELYQNIAPLTRRSFLAGSTLLLGASALEGLDVHMLPVKNTAFPRGKARNLLAKDMLESDCTDLLFIDSDINFEPDDVLRLMAWGSDPKKGIVAGVPRTRSTDKVYIADLEYDANGELTMNGMGLVRATRVATAFMLVRREVFETLAQKHPEWDYDDKRSNRRLNAVFDFKVTDEGYMGEDFLFCDRARAEGFEVWIDPTIKLGHMGVQEYMGDFGKDCLYPMIAPVQKVSNG